MDLNKQLSGWSMIAANHLPLRLRIINLIYHNCCFVVVTGTVVVAAVNVMFVVAFVDDEKKAVFVVVAVVTVDAAAVDECFKYECIIIYNYIFIIILCLLVISGLFKLKCETNLFDCFCFCCWCSWPGLDTRAASLPSVSPPVDVGMKMLLLLMLLVVKLDGLQVGDLLLSLF
ncbi:hypothetical protein FF38_03830 [Lucilia cuprina]|uniref:Transmembrane protein n=1 Tax=Lucilia cuprina TaxID=7375 RepID=A0A0L0CMN2_LUCCU|nr:hypothetical protein FF38_03830 [Lucilia cuprina]